VTPAAGSSDDSRRVAQRRGANEGRRSDARTPESGPTAAEARTARKEVARLERSLDRLAQRSSALHAEMAEHATDYARITELDAQLRAIDSEKAAVEDAWLAAAERAGDG
jgi:ABC transport system ATP-binding/permease protein